MADRSVRCIFDFKLKRQHADIRCGGCGWHVIVPPESVIRMFSPMLSLRDAEKRLRCRRCGKREATLRALWREYHG
ncbi:hypothetical protein AB2M62_13945 [Sphingomonas sp. MMS12-HWE2-04]|uniref:hypothetical protein n=1 Tax=Sphingomonas sp. MMS12-HWE2-04 TaxID=3234199 RepID=UPI00384D5C40